jgi:hypothetical protein
VAAVTFQNPPEPEKMIDVVERHMGSAKCQGKDRTSFFTADNQSASERALEA